MRLRIPPLSTKRMPKPQTGVFAHVAIATMTSRKKRGNEEALKTSAKKREGDDGARWCN